jgi:hypothetical protein
VPAQIKPQQDIARLIERRGDMGIAAGVFAQAMHQAHDGPWPGVRFPALGIERQVIGALPGQFKMWHGDSCIVYS